MNKKYFAPTMQVEEAQAIQILAASVGFYDEEIDGADALTKEDNSWDEWDEE